MQELTAVRSVRQAVRMLKRMEVEGWDWDQVHAAGGDTIRDVLQDRMHGPLGNRLADLAARTAGR